MELILVVVVVGSVVLWTRRDRRALAPEGGAALLGAGRFRPDRHLDGAPAPWRTLPPLVRVEIGRLWKHPAPYLLFLPVALIIGISSTYSNLHVASLADVEVAVFLVPFAWGAIVAADLNVLRSRRWGTDELLAALPVPTGSRTIAHALAPVVLAVPAVVIVAVLLALSAAGGRAIGTPRPIVLLVGPLLVVGGGCLGVAVGRWLPRPGLGWVAVLVSFALQVNLGHLDLHWRWLHFSAYASESLSYPELAPEPHGWHAVYLAGGILLVGTLAVLRSRHELRLLAVLAIAVVTIVVTGWLQVRPLSEAEVTSFASRLEHPERHQRCAGRDQITYCAVDPLLDLVDAWHAPVQGVWQRVPADERPPALTVRERPVLAAIAEAPDEVLAAVDPTVVWPDDDEVAVSRSWAFPAPSEPHRPGAYQLALGFRVASLLLDLPPDASWAPADRGEPGSNRWATALLEMNAKAGEGLEDTRAFHGTVTGPVAVCTAGGQARAVAALWLAGQATPAARDHLRVLAGTLEAVGDLERTVALDTDDSYRTGLLGPIPVHGTAVRADDLVAAARLLEQPDDDVARVLGAHWSAFRSADLTWADARAWFAPLGDAPLPVPPHDPDDPSELLDQIPPRPRYLAGPCDGRRPDPSSRP